MKKASYLAELEFRYVYALQAHSMQVGEGQLFSALIVEYIDQYHDKSDIVHDITEYLTLLS